MEETKKTDSGVRLFEAAVERVTLAAKQIAKETLADKDHALDIAYQLWRDANHATHARQF